MGTGLVRMLHVTFPIRELLRLMASALGAALLVLPLLWISSSPWMQFCGGLVYLVAFITATMQLRAWQAKDGQLLLSLIQRKPQVFKRVTPWVERWAQSLPAE